MAVRRHTKADPCIVCGGHQDMQRGQGTRCIGFESGDGWVHCSRLGENTRAKYHAQSQTWSHRIEGDCPCGEIHSGSAGADTTSRPPPRRPKAPAAEVREIGEAKRARLVETYDYTDVAGRLLYQVCRMEPKTFRQRRPSKDKPGEWHWSMKAGGGYPEQPTTLYRLPELIPALAAGDPIWICEGEKDVEAFRRRDQVATCNTGGAGKWRDELAGAFKGADRARIRIVQDRDPAEMKGVSGQQHAMAIFESLAAVLPESCELSIVEAREGKDASDHFAAGHGLTDFVQAWPIPDDLIEREPGKFKRMMLKRALESPKTVLRLVDNDRSDATIERQLEHHQPIYKSGIVAPAFYPDWRGAVAISGEPSSGKSFVAIATAIDAAIAGWDVFYLSAEMHEDIIRDRAARAVASGRMSKWDWQLPRSRAEAVAEAKRVKLPDRWFHIDVGIGVSIEDIIGLLVEHMTDRPTLVVFDSISSFVDSMGGEDDFGMANLRHVAKWIVGSRKLTHGHVAFILLSEMNKDGRIKGRFLDHRCDTAISMRSVKDKKLRKEIEITKSWWGQTGIMGEYLLDWELGRLRPSDDDDEA